MKSPLRLVGSLIIAIFLSLSIAVMLVPHYSVYGKMGEVGYTITLYKQLDILLNAWLVAGFCVVGYTILRSFQTRNFYGLLWLLGEFVVAVVCGNLYLLNSILDWKSGPTITIEKARYSLLNKEISMGPALAIARLDSSTRWMDRYTPLVETSLTDDAEFLRIVRPQSVASEFESFQFAQDDKLLGLMDHNHLYVAYDLETKQPFTGKALARLSPFLMLGPTDKPSEEDRKAVLADGIGSKPVDAIPVLQAELKNPNPAVRELAAKLLESAKATQQVHS